MPTPPPPTDQPAARVVSREQGRAGELVLRERGQGYEIISNGVFLMDTSDGRSERLLVRSALEAIDDGQAGGSTAPDGAAGASPSRRILLGGLGVGFSLAEALASADVAEVVVVEWEEAVVTWNRTATGPRTGGNVDDPRVRCDVADLVTWLRRPATETFDAICLDVDNGPHWTVTPENAWLYSDEGLTACRTRLVDGGVLSVWSAEHVPSFEDHLKGHFAWVERREVPVARGAPDVVYLARR
jgi:spermidine synthase